MGIVGIRLDVKFEEKELVKQYGARWSQEKKTWYLPFWLDENYHTKSGKNYYEIKLKDVARWFPANLCVYSIFDLHPKCLGIVANIGSEEDEKEAEQLGMKKRETQNIWYLPLCNEEKESFCCISDLQKYMEWFSKELLVYEKDRVFVRIMSGYPCWKCKKQMDIIETYVGDMDNEDGVQYAQSYCEWGKTKAFVNFAKELGVKMAYRKTSMVDEPYAIHVCPHCGSVQGDYYIFEESLWHDLTVKNSIYAIYDAENDTWTMEK